MADGSDRVGVWRQIELIQPDTPDTWREASALIDDYAARIGIDLGFQNFHHERRALEQEYRPPDGCLLIAQHDTTFVGCGAIRRLTASACEMKRLYVVPAMQGRRVGRSIAEALISRARAIGYSSMLLDTLPSMETAQRLYMSLGFVQVDAYRHNPIAGASFWKLAL
jgi:putative acetyltransferase